MEGLASLKPATPEAPKYEKKVDAQGRAYATGKRKNAVARVWIKPGAGKITVNTRTVEVFFARPVLRMMIQQPLVAANRAGNRADHVVLSGAIGGDQRLLDHHAQHRTREEHFHGAGIDRDLAGARLDPDAGDRV